jgi:hypothetical protein
MAETSAIEPAVSEPLTWMQICERYPDQWVVLVEIQKDPEDYSIRFQTARVAGIGKTSSESFAQGQPFKRGYPGYANRFTGPVTRSIAHLLR